jgi:hypothetical protein
MRWWVCFLFTFGCVRAPGAPDGGPGGSGFGVRSAANFDDNQSGYVTTARLAA